LGERLGRFGGQTRQHIALIAFLAWVGGVIAVAYNQVIELFRTGVAAAKLLST
jgi:hypothetical protein